MIAVAARVGVVEWAQAHQDICSIRRIVFVEEQGVPEELDRDGLDPDCLHVLAWSEQGQATGTARMQEDGKIGRMAALKPWRRHRLGRTLLEAC